MPAIEVELHSQMLQVSRVWQSKREEENEKQCVCKKKKVELAIIHFEREQHSFNCEEN
jgi:hypothetical protein